MSKILLIKIGIAVFSIVLLLILSVWLICILGRSDAKLLSSESSLLNSTVSSRVKDSSSYSLQEIGEVMKIKFPAQAKIIKSQIGDGICEVKLKVPDSEITAFTKSLTKYERLEKESVVEMQYPYFLDKAEGWDFDYEKDIIDLYRRWYSLVRTEKTESGDIEHSTGREALVYICEAEEGYKYIYAVYFRLDGFIEK